MHLHISVVPQADGQDGEKHVSELKEKIEDDFVSIDSNIRSTETEFLYQTCHEPILIRQEPRVRRCS